MRPRSFEWVMYNTSSRPGLVQQNRWCCASGRFLPSFRQPGAAVKSGIRSGYVDCVFRQRHAHDRQSNQQSALITADVHTWPARDRPRPSSQKKSWTGTAERFHFFNLCGLFLCGGVKVVPDDNRAEIWKKVSRWNWKMRTWVGDEFIWDVYSKSFGVMEEGGFSWALFWDLIN